MVKPRTAELVLVTPKGDPVGCLPAVPVATPWWPDIEPVVQAVRDHHGVDVIVLRLLDAELALLWHFRLGDICKEPVTVRTLSGWRSCEEVEDRLPDGRHAWLWWRS